MTEKNIQTAIQQYVSAKNMLYDYGIIRTEKITAEIGEWLFCNLFNAEQATSATQKGWDAQLINHPIYGNIKVQIKTHAKRPDNNARWTRVKIDPIKPQSDYFDYLSIIVFSNQFMLKSIYMVPFDKVFEMLTFDSDVATIYWDHISEYQLSLENLNSEIINIFGVVDGV